jgi:hypothetical protein
VQEYPDYQSAYGSTDKTAQYEEHAKRADGVTPCRYGVEASSECTADEHPTATRAGAAERKRHVVERGKRTANSFREIIAAVVVFAAKMPSPRGNVFYLSTDNTPFDGDESYRKRITGFDESTAPACRRVG